MPNQGMMKSGQGKHDWEIEEDQGFFGGWSGWSAEEDAFNGRPMMPMMMPMIQQQQQQQQQMPQEPMMPIPWKQEKPDEDAHYKDKDVSADHFTGLSTEQLQEMALTRKRTIENLKREVNSLTSGDGKHDGRLVALEKKFGELCNGSDLEFKAPLLSKIAKMVRESHLLDHEEEMARIKEA